MYIHDVIPLGIAVLSLLISAVVAYAHLKSSGEHLKILLKRDLFFNKNTNSEEWFYILEVFNSGKKPLTISSWALKLPNDKNLNFPSNNVSSQLPCELSGNRSCSFRIPADLMVWSIVKNECPDILFIVPQVMTESGKIFTGQKLEFEVADWLI